VLVLLDDRVTGKGELTGMIDVATRTMSAAMLGRQPGRSMSACCWRAA